MKKTLFFVTLLIFGFNFAQQGYRDSNRIGIGGGLTQFNISTDNFKVIPKMGWIAGMHVRGNFYNDFQMSYGLQFMESKFALNTLNGTTPTETEFKYAGVQLFLLPGYTVVENHFNVELGPVLQFNDKLKIDNKDQTNVLVDQPTLKAKDIIGISKFSGAVYGGINVGVTHARLRLGYTYGFTNMFGALNGDNNVPQLSNKFQGNYGYFSGQLTFYL
jgi:hypothetical protein